MKPKLNSMFQRPKPHYQLSDSEFLGQSRELSMYMFLKTQLNQEGKRKKTLTYDKFECGIEKIAKKWDKIGGIMACLRLLSYLLSYFTRLKYCMYVKITDFFYNYPFRSQDVHLVHPPDAGKIPYGRSFFRDTCFYLDCTVWSSTFLV